MSDETEAKARVKEMVLRLLEEREIASTNPDTDMLFIVVAVDATAEKLL